MHNEKVFTHICTLCHILLRTEVITSRRMRWPSMGEMRNANRILVGQCVGKMKFRKLRL
jgi:hypothetical protein